MMKFDPNNPHDVSSTVEPSALPFRIATDKLIHVLQMDHLHTRNESERGLETARLAAFRQQVLVRGLVAATRVIYDSDRVADRLQAYGDELTASLDSEWREHSRERWSFRPADILPARLRLVLEGLVSKMRTVGLDTDEGLRAELVEAETILSASPPPEADARPVLEVRPSPALAQLITAAADAARIAPSEWMRRAALYYLSGGAPPVVAELADDDP